MGRGTRGGGKEGEGTEEREDKGGREGVKGEGGGKEEKERKEGVSKISQHCLSYRNSFWLLLSKYVTKS